jgi:c-di-GMP-binding flagellar brake protein YcgR
MEAIKPRLGSKLELELYDSNGRRMMPILISQFEELLPDGTMEILTPIHEGRIFIVHRDTQVGVIYGKDGELFRFPAVILDYKKSGNIHLLMIKPLGGEEKYQRRSFFRLKCLLDVEYRFTGQNSDKQESVTELRKAVTRDISGGGMSLLLNDKPVVGQTMKGVCKMGNDVKFEGRIVRVRNVTDEGKFKYEAGIEFTGIKDIDRERIIGFIFELERKLLNKGWQTK